jgi:uncharacterized protein (DUF362 family)
MTKRKFQQDQVEIEPEVVEQVPEIVEEKKPEPVVQAEEVKKKPVMGRATRHLLKKFKR